MGTVKPHCRHCLAELIAALLLSAGSPGFAAPDGFSAGNDSALVESELPPLQISHVGADMVYLNGGRSHGLSVGQVVEVIRDGEPIAEMQVAFLSTKSAACRVIESRLEVVQGDLAVPIADAGPTATSNETGTGTRGAPLEFTPPDTAEERRLPSSPPTGALAWGDVSGTVSIRWHHFEDGSDVPRSFDQTTTRLNLRVQSLTGAYETRIRVRGREDRRYRESEPTETLQRDRLYEFALTYEPPEGHVFVEIGRMSSGPLVGFDYLDGIVGEYKVRPHFGIGGFYGQRSLIDEISLGAEGEAYGTFIHYRRERSRESPFYGELVLGAIRELYEGEISREYLSLYGRLGSGSRWSFYQRADVDINTAWRREVVGDDYQLSNLLTSFNYRFSDSLRLGVSYDHRRRYRDLDNRDTPEEIFDDRLRDGLRLTAQIGDAKGWRLTSSVGVRREEARATDAYTATGSLFNTSIGGHNLLLGLDFSGFRGESSDGFRVSLRARKYFAGGHDLGLTVGTSSTTNSIGSAAAETVNEWVRLSGTFRLPWRFFVLTEAEITEGDDLAGERFIIQLGYRL